MSDVTAPKKTVFVQILKEYQEYFSTMASGYAVFSYVAPEDVKLEAGVLSITNGDGTILIPQTYFVTVSIMN